jgi:2-polyprenyl-3-methyl-5-hydroxy-6-metoxy-1,4-benzoquinol methylase
MTNEYIDPRFVDDNESQRLKRIAKDGFTQFDKDQKVSSYRAKTIVSLCEGPRVLDVGCADGLVTEILANEFPGLVTIDGSIELIERLRQRVPSIKAVHTLFEDFTPNELFDTIVMGHVLEHVDEPVALLTRAKDWLCDGGKIIVTVPNAESIHRRIGLEMGMITELTELSEGDHLIGHRRIYSTDTLEHDIESAGLRTIHSEGVMLKPLTNAAMFDWADELLAAFNSLAKKLPTELGGELCFVCAP